MPDAEAQLDSFLDKYTPEVAGQARAALEALRRLVPGAVELVYDNYNALAIGFWPIRNGAYAAAAARFATSC